ncbi:hypothetical protein [Candidatus Clostridium radicumherbarum]|uniref:Uncharacterized protein n=1 Tax=Candidatus Clostridium radicumherbarum TaxID=3381662 RepID=A0ABW8TW09_9CLOT
MKNINRNIAIGSIIAAAGIGAVIYPILKNSKKNNIKENNYEAENEASRPQVEIEKEDNKIVKSANDVLLNKIGATKSELEEARILNKTAYDVAIDKGFSKEQLRMFVNQDRTRDVDELALNRKISNNVAEKAKEKIIEDTNNWNGMFC